MAENDNQDGPDIVGHTDYIHVDAVYHDGNIPIVIEEERQVLHVTPPSSGPQIDIPGSGDGPLLIIP